MLKCLIIDDEPLAHDVIVDYASEISYLTIVAQVYRPIKALEVLKTQSIDLIFLDIKMPKLNGLEMLSLLENQPQVIITTAYEEYALRSYEFNVADYLLKPFRLDRFMQAVEKAKTKIESNTKNNNESNHLLIKSDKRLIKVDPSSIQYIESYGNYIKIWINTEIIISAQTLIHFTSLIPQDQFFKIHKSYVVNKNHFDYIEGNTLHMKNGNKLAISKNYKQSFLDFLEKNYSNYFNSK